MQCYLEIHQEEASIHLTDAVGILLGPSGSDPRFEGVRSNLLKQELFFPFLFAPVTKSLPWNLYKARF